jgi:hypothetical protein
MNTPGFSTEAAFYKTGGRYGVTASGDTALGKQEIIPASFYGKLFWGLHCISACTACAVGTDHARRQPTHEDNCWLCNKCLLDIGVAH